jgi:hypothetical protein
MSTYEGEHTIFGLLGQANLYLSVNLKEERFVLAHSFRGFSPQSVGLLVFGLWQPRTAWQEQVAEEAFSPHSGQETKRDRKGPESHYLHH